jgi:hypothetical protein
MSVIVHSDRTSVADAVYAQLTAGSYSEHDEPTMFLDRRPLLEGNPSLGEWELDLRDWGLAFGMAWMLHRAEDPFAKPADIGERAFKDGWAAWTRWSGEFHQRPPVLAEYVAALNKRHEDELEAMAAEHRRGRR